METNRSLFEETKIIFWVEKIWIVFVNFLRIFLLKMTTVLSLGKTWNFFIFEKAFKCQTSLHLEYLSEIRFWKHVDIFPCLLKGYLKQSNF